MRLRRSRAPASLELRLRQDLLILRPRELRLPLLRLEIVRGEVVCRRGGVDVESAVVAKPDEKWGEVPAAFIELREGAPTSEAEIIEHCRAHLARFKVPKQVVFGALPKTSTGKIQKYILRQHASSVLAIE